MSQYDGQRDAGSGTIGWQCVGEGVGVGVGAKLVFECQLEFAVLHRREKLPQPPELYPSRMNHAVTGELP
jgi:hypothetical protein